MPEKSNRKERGENICKVPGTAHDIETMKVEFNVKKIDTLGIYTHYRTTRPLNCLCK